MCETNAPEVHVQQQTPDWITGMLQVPQFDQLLQSDGSKQT